MIEPKGSFFYFLKNRSWQNYFLKTKNLTMENSLLIKYIENIFLKKDEKIQLKPI